MAGIYIHIPFCRKACYYCNFHFSTSFALKEKLVEALIREIESQKTYLDHQPVSTIYFGGGTPSALEPSYIQSILRAIDQNFAIETNAEITLEANPEDIQTETLFEWKEMGLNRLSIGVQGFQDEMLTAWNRVHDARHGLQSLVLAKGAGFHNISADLIYGDPLLKDEDWIQNIQELVDLGIPHISCYALTVETGTALFHQIDKGKKQPLDEEQSFRQFSILQKMASAQGYDQYEISNFGKPGFYSKHNTSYWTGEPYLGIGPSAHSFNGNTRQWNVSHNVKYVDAISKHEVPAEAETLSLATRYNEWIMTGLRTARGIETEAIKKLGADYFQTLQREIQPFLDQKKIFINELGNYTLAKDQYFFADGIAADLFISSSP